MALTRLFVPIVRHAPDERDAGMRAPWRQVGMHVREQWADNDNGDSADHNPWLEYEARKRQVACAVVPYVAAGPGNTCVTALRGLTPREYEDAILALCTELKL